MDKTHHGLVIALFSLQLLQLFSLRRRCPVVTNLFLLLLIDRYVLAIQEIVTHEEHLRDSFCSEAML